MRYATVQNSTDPRAGRGQDDSGKRNEADAELDQEADPDEARSGRGSSRGATGPRDVGEVSLPLRLPEEQVREHRGPDIRGDRGSPRLHAAGTGAIPAGLVDGRSPGHGSHRSFPVLDPGQQNRQGESDGSDRG